MYAPLRRLRPARVERAARLRRRGPRACGRALALVGALLVVWPMTGCAGRRGPSGAPLRVAVAPYYPPIVFEADGRVVGLEADLAAAVAEQLGRPLEFVRMTRQELIPAVQSGRVDVAMSGISITPERAKRVLFTEPYMHVGQLALIRIEDLGELSRPTGLRRPGVRIGTVAGSTGEAWVSETLPGADHRSFENAEAGVRSLRARGIDVFIHDAPTVWRIGSVVGERELIGLYTPLTDEELAWAVPRKSADLKARLDGMLEVWRANGELDRVLNRWLPVRVEVRR